MTFISIASPQGSENHQKEEIERRTAGDIHKHCGAARPTKPSAGRERESGKAGDIYKHCGTARPIKHQKEERERGENLVIFISVAGPQDL